MDDVVLAEVVQRYEYLNSKSFDQIQGEALEMVHLDKLIQIHTQHFEDYHQVLPKVELVDTSNNVFLIIQVFIVQMLNQLGFNETLFV